MIVTTTVFGHLFKALRRSLSRVFLLFLVSGLIAVVAAEIIAIVITGALPNIYATSVALALGVAVGYSAALMTLIWEVFRDMIATVEEMGKDFARDLTSGPALIEKAIDTVGRHL
jgi:glycerol-3-phosphate dehydrogenase